MKKLLFLLFIMTSCVAVKETKLAEDEMFVTRKYVGNFITYVYTEPERLGNPSIVWIKTTQDSVYGKLSILSKECKFERGERLYIRRTYYTMGLSGYWSYQLESDKDNKPYRLSEFQYDKKIRVQSWF